MLMLGCEPPRRCDHEQGRRRSQCQFSHLQIAPPDRDSADSFIDFRSPNQLADAW
jgi:hypothetical protein